MAEKPVLYHVGRKFSSNIDRRRYFVRDMVAASVLKLVPVRTHLRTHLSTHLMVAVALTKSLPSPAHIKDREMMLGHVPSPFAARTGYDRGSLYCSGAPFSISERSVQGGER